MNASAAPTKRRRRNVLSTRIGFLQARSPTRRSRLFFLTLGEGRWFTAMMLGTMSPGGDDASRLQTSSDVRVRSGRRGLVETELGFGHEPAPAGEIGVDDGTEPLRRSDRELGAFALQPFAYVGLFEDAR